MILIINRSKKEGRRLADSFYYMGVLSYAVTPSEAFSEISPLYRAAVIVNPETLPDERNFIKHLRSYVSNIPLYALSEQPNRECAAEYKKTLKPSTYSAVLYSNMCRQLDKRAPGIYKLAGINASAQLCVTQYFYTVMPLTKTENMILRTLIKAYPARIDAKSILKYAFKTSSVPEPSNIRTHISVMNKKFREYTGRNLISSEAGVGYKIITPELEELF